VKSFALDPCKLQCDEFMRILSLLWVHTKLLQQ
jgi:hypothetical protein